MAAGLAARAAQRRGAVTEPAETGRTWGACVRDGLVRHHGVGERAGDRRTRHQRSWAGDGSPMPFEPRWARLPGAVAVLRTIGDDAAGTAEGDVGVLVLADGHRPADGLHPVDLGGPHGHPGGGRGDGVGGVGQVGRRRKLNVADPFSDGLGHRDGGGAAQLPGRPKRRRWRSPRAWWPASPLHTRRRQRGGRLLPRGPPARRGGEQRTVSVRGADQGCAPPPPRAVSSDVRVHVAVPTLDPGRRQGLEPVRGTAASGVVSLPCDHAIAVTASGVQTRNAGS